MRKINVLIAGLPGKMATLLAESIVRQDDMILYPFALSEEAGPECFDGFGQMNLISPDYHRDILESNKDIDVIVDFTLPRSVNRNAELYCKVGIPFVMGTTGGNREELVKTVEDSKISAVIATNMATPVVIFQEMIKHAAKSFPKSLEGFELVIQESHQAVKPDPSGTAISLLGFFKELGMPLEKEQIIMLRDPDLQETVLNIPNKYLGGHGYHTYTLTSPDGTVVLQFKHNVLGRNVYVEGALTAIRFLAKSNRLNGTVFSMNDVLRGAN